MSGTTTKVATLIGGSGANALLLALNSEPNIRRLGITHTPTEENFTFMESSQFNNSHSRISGASVLNFHLFLSGLTPEREYDKLQALVGDDVPCLFSVENDVLTAPSPTNPVKGCVLTVNSWVPEGGDINVQREITQDQPVSGAIERLEALPAAAASLLAVAAAGPQITLTWDLDTETLTSVPDRLRVTRFDVYRALSSGSILSDYALLAAGTNLPAAIASDTVSENTFVDLVVSPLTAYFYVVVTTDRFGMRSVISAEVTDTTP